jgi:O-antigen/teichoic acid export membrane protein
MIARLIFVASAYALHVFSAYYFNDPVVYGNLAVALNISAIGLVFIQFGFPQSISKFISDNKKESYDIFLAGKHAYMIFGLVVFIIYLSLTPFWMFVMKDNSLLTSILISSFLIPIFTFNNSFMSYLNGCQRFKEQSFFVGLYPVTRILFAFLFILLGFQIRGVFIGFVIAGLINAYFLYNKINKKAIKKRTYSSRPITTFAVPVICMSIGIALYMNIDMIIVKHFFHKNDVVGFYAASSTISKIPYYIYFAYSMTIIPIISRFIKESKYDQTIITIKKCLYSLCSFIVLSSLFVSIFADDILRFVYPNGYSSLSTVMAILFLSMGILSFFQTLSSIYISIGKVRLAAAIIYVILSLQVIMSFFSIPHYGVIGMAYSSIIPVSFGSFVLMILLIRSLREITQNKVLVEKSVIFKFQE